MILLQINQNHIIFLIHFQGTSTKSLERGGRSAALVGSGWGARSGTEDDMVDLKEIISAELIKPENYGDCFSYLNQLGL